MDDGDSFSHFVMALGYTWSGELDNAIAESELTVSMNPNNAEGYAILGHSLAMNGNMSEGIRNSEKALQLNPRDPRRYVFMTHIALAHLIGQEYE